jgi:SAM-dependent methyltransferase
MTAGLRQIVRFNWTQYALGISGIVVVVTMTSQVPMSTAGRVLLLSGPALAGIWIAASLVASWMVYDHSPLTEWSWVGDAVGFHPLTWVNIHAGLDESTPALCALFSPSRGRVFDIFDAAEMTEPSIARARHVARPKVEPEVVDFRQLPVAAGGVDAVFLLLSAHELRQDAARHAFFAEVQRVLSPHGRVVVAEHLRDVANFGAFGPGFLHFHSRRTWQRCFASAQLAIDSEFSITPFVHVFVLKRAA